jgi:aspartyl/asparaginyl beta-hydroxylase (cupin superfamily)
MDKSGKTSANAQITTERSDRGAADEDPGLGRLGGTWFLMRSALPVTIAKGRIMHGVERKPDPPDMFSTPGIHQNRFAALKSRVLLAVTGLAERWNWHYSKVGNPSVYENSTFPWVAAIEHEWRAIRSELDSVLKRRDELPAFHEIAADVRAISADANWKTLLLAGYGIRSNEGARLCPQTWRIVQRIPGLKTAMFSIFEPGKHLPAHRGPYNGVLRLHLGLIVPDQPEKIGIRVGENVCHWEEGRVLIFDDAYEHEAWNYSDSVRVVLFVDFVKPLRFPANVLNWCLLNLAVFTPFIREGYKAQKQWERRFYGTGARNRTPRPNRSRWRWP